jgi:hypothetical protein
LIDDAGSLPQRVALLERVVSFEGGLDRNEFLIEDGVRVGLELVEKRAFGRLKSGKRAQVIVRLANMMTGQSRGAVATRGLTTHTNGAIVTWERNRGDLDDGLLGREVMKVGFHDR